jgi:hypothetical protein
VNVADAGNVLGYGGPVVAGADYEHINVGALSEGYVLCYLNPKTGAYVNAFDLGAAQSGFGPASPTNTEPDPQDPNALPGMQVVRATSDGLLTLKQSFRFDGEEKRMQVIMDVINYNAFPITGVILRRQADFDVDGGGADGWAGTRNETVQVV